MQQLDEQTVASLLRLIEKPIDWTAHWHSASFDTSEAGIFDTSKAGIKIAALNPSEQVSLAVAIANRVTQPELNWQERSQLLTALDVLLSSNLPFDHDSLLAVLKGSNLNQQEIDLDALDKTSWERNPALRELYHFSHELISHFPQIAKAIAAYTKQHELTPELRSAAIALCSSISPVYRQHNYKEILQLQTAAHALPLLPGEAWSDGALADLAAMTSPERENWTELLVVCAKAPQSRPSKKWQKEADAALNRVGRDKFSQLVFKWFPLVDKPRTDPDRYYGNPNLIDNAHAEVLKGLVWLCPKIDTAETAQAVANLALSAYRRVPNVGERCVRLGNACVWALGQMSAEAALGQLAILQAKVKYRGAQKEIAKALSGIADRTGQSVETLTEAAIPTYGLTAVGERREQLGDFSPVISVVNTQTVEIRWSRPDGKLQKSVPKAVKENYADDLKALKQAVTEIKKMLLVQRDRIEGSYLQRRVWKYDEWAKNYLNHPLVGTLARRLIWQFGPDKIAAIWQDGQLITLTGAPVDKLASDAAVTLWHPLNASVEEVLAWRDWLMDHQIQQPFKQAHREVYLLTDAEEGTFTHSNRFAAHIIRQHQFNALSKSRDWQNSLILPYDCGPRSGRAVRQLPAWELQAEFWVDAVVDGFENVNSAYPYVVTDQVRFTKGNSNPSVPLTEIPPLVFSEVMRDVDLFVGVASIGNDPNWQAGDRQEHYDPYWRDYAFGELAETAKTRRQLLKRLVPRLKIASRCQVTERFLVVKGNLRTYKIHLGSSNIQMEPNNQYLCIVPGRGQATAGVFLPFEGDPTTAVILSKALMLAEDDKITDQSIVSQISAASFATLQD